jgi:hypothetical protein
MATASAPVPPREKIRFEFGQPVTLILKYPQGKEVAGQYGPQFFYTTLDERVFYVDPDIGYQIEKCPGAAEGAPITIMKCKGPRNATNWEIRPAVTNGPRAVVYAQPAQQPPSELETRLEASIAHAQARRNPEPQQQPVTTAQAKLLAALCVAIDCCVEAEAYAKRRGLPLGFSSEDVRCFANTIVINAERAR